MAIQVAGYCHQKGSIEKEHKLTGGLKGIKILDRRKSKRRLS